ncbi:hypothetical protein [Streptomyces sp. NPDC101132]|uniref:hypothetical protein n=1 Tax=Streptomyces sp. NPDC101132 TaxID=3366110 RepID=UPI00382EC837
MSDIKFTTAPHPLAKPGYGKITAPDQLARTRNDFSDLPIREAAVASYIDRLPDGADISVKTLAAVLPLWGQCALRTALNRLVDAGHLCRQRERIGSSWVTRTYFSRTARDGAWWARFTRKDAPAPTAPPPPEPAPEPPPPAAPSRDSAFGILAGLGRHDPRLTLSKADCSTLAPLVAAWLAKGATAAQITLTLTAGLPRDVHHPAAFVRKRLEAKLPPDPVERPPAPVRAECADCRAPGPPSAFRDGLCAPCRNQPPAPPRGLLPPDRVRAHATRIREGRRT